MIDNQVRVILVWEEALTLRMESQQVSVHVAMPMNHVTSTIVLYNFATLSIFACKLPSITFHNQNCLYRMCRLNESLIMCAMYIS